MNRLKPTRPNQSLRFDIEANGFNELTIDKSGTIIKEASQVWVMWVQDLFDRSFTGYRGDEIVEGVKRLWAADWIGGHNIIQYDIPVLERVTGLPKPATCRPDDSLIRSRVLWPESYKSPMQGNDLDAWGRWLVMRGKLEGGKGAFHGPWDRWTQEMDDYCRQDVAVHEAIDDCLATIAQNETVVRIEHACTAIIARQTMNGWCFDREAAQKMIAEFDIKRCEVMDKLQAAFPPRVETLKTPAYYEVVGSRGNVIHSAPTKGQCEAWLKLTLNTMSVKRKDFKGAIRPGPLRTKLHPFNPGSSQQVLERLVERYKFEPTEPTEGGAEKERNGEKLLLSDYKCDYDVLVKLDYPEVRDLLEYADVDKMMEMLIDYEKRSTFSRDGKIHGSINVQGCVTGRMSHKQPNMGNVPKAEKDKDGNYKGVSWKIRTLFTTRPGWKEVGGDASALEDRMLRNRMGRYDPREMVLKESEDMHTANMMILRVVVPTVTRDNAKTFWYGILYGAGDKKAGKIVGRGPDIGKRMKEAFFRGRPALAKLIAYCQSQAENVGHLTLLDGRKVPCRSKHAALNTQLQGDGACVMKVALIVTDTELMKRGYVPGKDYEFLGNIHDEFQMESRPEIAEEVGKVIVWAIQDAGRRLGCKVRLDGEYKVGDSWAQCH